MGMCDSGPHPMRVLTVTGSDTALTTRLAIVDHRRRIAQPTRPRAAARDLGHPAAAVDVDESGPASSATRAASTRRSGSEP